ncbi:MAG: RNase P subunit p30 family protein [Candidatus Aenigmatarchaeota archaeon]
MWDIAQVKPEDSEFAKKIGIEGLFILSEKPIKRAEGIRWAYKVEWKSVDEIKEKIKQCNKKADLLFISAEGLKMNREILSLKWNGVINSTKLDYVCVRLAKENSISIIFDINALIERSGFERAALWSSYWRIARLVRKYKAPFAIISNAKSIWQLRSPSELIAFGRKLGFQDPDIRAGLKSFI